MSSLQYPPGTPRPLPDYWAATVEYLPKRFGYVGVVEFKREGVLEWAETVTRVVSGQLPAFDVARTHARARNRELKVEERL